MFEVAAHRECAATMESLAKFQQYMNSTKRRDAVVLIPPLMSVEYNKTVVDIKYLQEQKLQLHV